MRSELYEQALTKQGVEWEYLEKFDLEDIDGAKSLRNQARLEEAVDQDLVDQYALAMKDGDQFPPLVIWKPNRGRYILIDGNQRLQAMRKLDRKRHDVYVVKTTDEMIVDRITWSFNNLVNGKRLSPAEALAHAVSWVRKYGRTIKEASQEWRLAVHKITRAVRVAEVRDSLHRSNVPHISRLSDDMLDTLAPLKTFGEDLLVAGAKLVTENGLAGKEAERMVKDVSTAKTSEAKKQALEEAAVSEPVRNRRAETKGGTVKVATSPRSRFLSLLRQLGRMLEDYPAKGVLRPPAGEEFEQTRDTAGDVVDRLVALFGLGRATGRKAQ